MAGTIAADTLTHSTAGSLTTDYVVNGSAKAWVNLNGDTAAVRDSNNVASVTDNGTGDYTTNLSGSMSDTNYGVSGACCAAGSVNSAANALQINSSASNTLSAPTTSAFRSICLHAPNAVKQDVDYLTLLAHGDLA